MSTVPSDTTVAAASNNDSYILHHMNNDHADSLLAYAQHYGKLSNIQSARLTNITLYGITLECTTNNQTNRSIDIPFTAPLQSTGEYKDELIRMSNHALHALKNTEHNTKYHRYYQLPNIPLSLAVLTGLYLCYHAGYSNQMPHPVLQPIKQYALHIFKSDGMIRTIFISAVVAHMVESIVAYVQLNKLGINDRLIRMVWLIQTFMLGYPSLGLLMKLKPSQQ